MRIPATEILKSIPELVGIRLNEQPKFTIVEKSKGVEVRSYVPIRLASTKVSSQSEDFRSVAFERLAKYIFGANAKNQEIPMTSPVFQERTGDGWTMSFALPAEFRAEPDLALAGGADGMDFIRNLFLTAAAQMNENAVLVLEIGNERENFQRAFPHLEPLWFETSAGSDQVLLLTREQLA